jgi:hypothetical protein
MSWWLAVRKGARLPTWDIAAECVVAGRQGMLLVEAKAHDREPDESGKPDESNSRNHQRIVAAIAAAGDGLNRVMPGWRLSHDRHYQLCNRFAWAWKLALLGVPVILIFLGVLDAQEMASSRRRIFSSLDDWRTVLLNHAAGIIPEAVWGRSLDINGTPLVSLIRSVRQGFEID